jgi:hypothetical protein
MARARNPLISHGATVKAMAKANNQPLNRSLHSAKTAKQDEFYTQ